MGFLLLRKVSLHEYVFFEHRVRSVDVLGCCFRLETHQLHHRNPYLEICQQQHMGYKPPNSYGVWDMGFGVEIPANQLGKCENVCGMREYGLYGVWVTRESTVSVMSRLTTQLILKTLV